MDKVIDRAWKIVDSLLKIVSLSVGLPLTLSRHNSATAHTPP